MSVARKLGVLVGSIDPVVVSYALFLTDRRPEIMSLMARIRVLNLTALARRAAAPEVLVDFVNFSDAMWDGAFKSVALLHRLGVHLPQAKGPSRFWDGYTAYLRSHVEKAEKMSNILHDLDMVS